MVNPVNTSSILSIVALTAFSVASAQAQPRVPRDDRDAIEVTTVSSRASDVEFGSATGIVDAPYADVVAIVHDYANYDAFMPHFHESRVLAARGTRAQVYMEVGVLRETITLWANVRISSRERDGKTVVEARMTEGNMETFIARWELSPMDDGRRALVEFRLLVDPDLPAVPDSLITGQNVRQARKAIIRLRRRVVALQ